MENLTIAGGSAHEEVATQAKVLALKKLFDRVNRLRVVVKEIPTREEIHARH